MNKNTTTLKRDSFVIDDVAAQRLGFDTKPVGFDLAVYWGSDDDGYKFALKLTQGKEIVMKGDINLEDVPAFSNAAYVGPGVLANSSMIKLLTVLEKFIDGVSLYLENTASEQDFVSKLEDSVEIALKL